MSNTNPNNLTPQQMQKELVDFGLAKDMDDAAHMLVDAGEIDSSQHEELLSDKERERVYGT